tara:strand:- start:310 stop:2289 length:1980 start_codon:yes stop_codon:yes gene_type:complete
MALGILVLITALAISAVAIYYSIAGLVAIFAAAAIPIIVMGTALEIGKLVTAVWLHRYWTKAKWWLKTYLTAAVVILMFITSMGIFGFLSKAHIEQTSASIESVEKISQLDTELARYKGIITRAEEKIESAENQGANQNNVIQDQIDREQKRIDTAYDRIQPLVSEQQRIVQQEIERKDKKIEPYLAQVSNIDSDLQTLSDLLNRRDSESIKRLQSIVGTRVDGTYGSNTAEQVENYREGLIAKRESILKTISQIEEKDSPIIISANEEIKRLRDIAQKEIEESNKVINKLREEIGSTTVADNNTDIIEENLQKIKNANSEIDILTEQKYGIQAEYRKLEAEVGPIKYIAEFVYGEKADKNLLEEAVRWVILIIIVVFDPLAVLLLIASQYTFEFARGRKKQLEWSEYETQRAAMIVANQGPDNETVDESTDDDIQSDDVEHDERDRKTNDEDDIQQGEAVESTEESVSDSESSKGVTQPRDDLQDINVAGNEEANGMLFGEDNLKKSEIKDRANLVKQYAEDEDWTEARNVWQKINPDEDPNNYRQAFISGRIHNLPWEVYLSDQKKSSESLDELAQKRADEIEYLDSLESWSSAKQLWKEENPHENLKTYKKAYIKGFIDKLPWEDYITRTEGYVQNEEQNDDSIWKRISDKPNNTT